MKNEMSLLVGHFFLLTVMFGRRDEIIGRTVQISFVFNRLNQKKFTRKALNHKEFKACKFSDRKMFGQVKFDFTRFTGS